MLLEENYQTLRFASFDEVIDRHAYQLSGTVKCSNQNCKVSFYISTFQSEFSVINSINSILNQDFQYEFCLTIVDDGSTDQTFEILSELSRQYNNVYLFKNATNFGAVPAVKLARKIALRVCRDSKYIALGSDHDLWSYDFLQFGYHALETFTNSMLYVPAFEAISQGQLPHYSFTKNTTSVHEPNPYTFQEYYGFESLKLCRAGHWMYGLERKCVSLEPFSFGPFDSPDQIYLYPLVYHHGIVISRTTQIAVLSKTRDQIRTRDASHFISKTLSSKIVFYFQSRLSRWITIVRISSNYRDNQRFSLMNFKFIIHVFLKIYRLTDPKRKLLKIKRRAFLRIRLEFKKIAKKLKHLLIPAILFLNKCIVMFPRPRLRLVPRILPQNRGKRAKDSDDLSLKIGLYVTTPGILRLLEAPIKLLLSQRNVEISVIAIKQSWKKKLTPDHLALFNELNNKRSFLKLVLLPKRISFLVLQSAQRMKRDIERLELNKRFYTHPDLCGEDLAAFRSFGRFGNFQSPSATSSELEASLQKRYFNNVVSRFFEKLDLDILLFSPVVNSHEYEIVSFAVKDHTKTLGIIASWDNLTVKGKLIDSSDSYIVWGAGQKDQGHRYHGIDSEKFHVVGPYAFSHLGIDTSFSPSFMSNQNKDLGRNSTSIIPRLVWLCSSAFVMDIANRGKFCELDYIAEFLSEMRKLGIDILPKLHIRLHPNCGYSIDEAVSYLISKDVHGIQAAQISKKEAVLIEDRRQYVSLLKSCDFVIGFATSSIVEAGILKKSAIAPISDITERSYSGLLHGSLLRSINGGPVNVFDNYKDLYDFIRMPRDYSPSGKFAEWIGLNLPFTNYSERFVDALLSHIPQVDTD